MGEAPTDAELPAGIVCPRCKGTEWGVWMTRRMPGRLVRVRTCGGCFLRVRTREVIEAVEDNPPTAS